MPHQCTNCGATFADGSKEMLSGCPGCGGNKFQYRPAGTIDDEESPAGDAPTPDAAGGAPDAADATPSGGPAASGDPEADSSAASPSRSPDAASPSQAPDSEDGAQASARTDVVSEEELAAAAESTASQPPAAEASDAEESDTVDPNLDALRQKLNDQFESIRIVSPGQYELNLMELYDREEYIISLREDGRYVIEMPEGWDDR